MAGGVLVRLDVLRHTFTISRQGATGMGSLIRATALWGYRELVHQCGGDANQFLSRFGIPRDADAQEGAFIGFHAYVHMLAASADELRCPDFGLRLSKWRGLDVL